MLRIDVTRFLALTAAIAGCSGSQRPESEPRREVATVSVPEPEPEPEDDAPDASTAPVPDAAASEAPDPGDESALARIGDSDAGVFGLLRMADGGGVTGFGHIGGLGGGGLGTRGGATGLGARSRSQVSQGSVKIQGGLDKDIIRRIVRRQVIRVRYCYERELAKDPKLTAKAVPRFTIAPDGSVASATMSQSSGNTSLDACILAVFRTLSFPMFDGGVVVVSYPLSFKPAP